MKMHLSICHALAMSVVVSALPSIDFLSNHQAHICADTSGLKVADSTDSLDYHFILVASPKENPSKSLPVGFPAPYLSVPAVLGPRTVFTLRNGVLAIREGLKVGEYLGRLPRNVALVAADQPSLPFKVQRDGSSTFIQVDHGKRASF